MHNVATVLWRISAGRMAVATGNVRPRPVAVVADQADVHLRHDATMVLGDVARRHGNSGFVAPAGGSLVLDRDAAGNERLLAVVSSTAASPQRP